MRTALTVLTIAHLVEFVVPWQLITSAEQPYRRTILQGRLDFGDRGIRLFGLGWLALALCLAVVAVCVILRSSWWLIALEGIVATSLIFCALDWPEARLGVLVNIAVLGLAFAVVRSEESGLAIRNETLESLWRSVPRGTVEASIGIPLPVCPQRPNSTSGTRLFQIRHRRRLCC